MQVPCHFVMKDSEGSSVVEVAPYSEYLTRRADIPARAGETLPTGRLLFIRVHSWPFKVDRTCAPGIAFQQAQCTLSADSCFSSLRSQRFRKSPIHSPRTPRLPTRDSACSTFTAAPVTENRR